MKQKTKKAAAKRFKITKDSPEKDEALNLIASFRSIFEPEEIFLDDNHQEKLSKEEYSKETMVEKTKNLIKRNYADIEVIITSNAEEYKDCSKNIPCMDIEEFFIHCMSIQKYREIIEKYLRVIEYEKASGLEN